MIIVLDCHACSQLICGYNDCHSLFLFHVLLLFMYCKYLFSFDSSPIAFTHIENDLVSP